MSSEILISVRPLETRVAYVNNGLLNELKIDRKATPTLVGSIHRGRVTRVLPGMQAAFVDIGLDRAAFLYVGDVLVPQENKKTIDVEDYEGSNDEDLNVSTKMAEEISLTEDKPNISELLQQGQQILVQVAKDPIGSKGARVTTHISLPGRFFVFMPTLLHIGISRRIEVESERERLRQFIESANPNGGIIIRTACEGATEAEMRQDLEYLERLWKDIHKNYEKRKTIGAVHTELEISIRALRDLLDETVEKVLIDDEAVFKKATRFISHFMPKFKNRLFLYSEHRPLFDMYDVDLEISRSMDRTVWLKSGGYIVVDEAEALVVIDVNTGKYVGQRDLDDTILKTNLEAAKEICHQIQVRNVGGIIIIDFIDMSKPSHREMLLNLLDEELKKDRAKTKVVSMSDLGLVEMTRKRIRPSLTKTLCEPCSYCDGKGYVKRKSTIAYEIFYELERNIGFIQPNQKPVISCHSAIVDWIYEVEEEGLNRLEALLKVSPVFKVEPGFHIEQFEISIL